MSRTHRTRVACLDCGAHRQPGESFCSCCSGERFAIVAPDVSALLGAMPARLRGSCLRAALEAFGAPTSERAALRIREARQHAATLAAYRGLRTVSDRQLDDFFGARP